MADFFQNGDITTLHRLTDRSLEEMEHELNDYVRKRPIGLIL
ncbi:MAG: glycosyl transferase, partial [Candidatus Thiodiazotropha sp.]